jgi:hypothetical protein
MYAFILSFMHATYHINFILLHLIIQIMSAETLKNMKLLIMYFSPDACCFLHFTFKYSPLHSGYLASFLHLMLEAKSHTQQAFPKFYLTNQNCIHEDMKSSVISEFSNSATFSKDSLAIRKLRFWHVC